MVLTFNGVERRKTPGETVKSLSTRRMAQDAKVFGLGLSKTGTSTLSEALDILGIRSIHYPHDDQTFDELKRGDYSLSVLRHYRSVTDTPVAPYYAQLDQTWPGSKFILTVREKNSWMRSAENHWRILKNTGQYAADSRFQAFTDFVNASVYGCLYFNAERFSFVYDRHIRSVREHFEGRPEDLLELDIVGGKGGWKELCEFLGLAVPAGIPFPHAYRTDWDMAEESRADLAALAPNGETIIVVDHEGLRNYLSASRRVMPFLELDGRYLGLPADDAEAIGELERQRAHRRSEFFAVTRSSAWFLERFAGFADYLRSRYACVLDTDRLLVFDLRN